MKEVERKVLFMRVRDLVMSVYKLGTDHVGRDCESQLLNVIGILGLVLS